MHNIKITPNLLFEYQCTSGKFIRLPNRTESKKHLFGSENRIESKLFFRPNWNALLCVASLSRGVGTILTLRGRTVMRVGSSAARIL